MRAKREAHNDRGRAAAEAGAARGLDSDQPFDLYVTPGFLVRRLHQIVVSLCVEGWGELNLSPVQYGVLMTIRAYPGVDQRGLARLVAIDRSTTGTVSAQLEAHGLIARRTGKRDKRNKELFLTRAGASLLRRAQPLAWEIQKRLLAPLNANDQAEFVRLLTILVEGNNAHSRAPLDRTGFEG